MATAQQMDREEGWTEFPAGTSLITHSPPIPQLDTPQQIQAYARAFDDNAFLAQIVGEAMDKWFYEFTIAGKKVEGVSVVGAEEFARLRAEQGFPIRFPPGSIRAEDVMQNGELGIRVTVVARDARLGADGLGMAFYPYMVERKKGDDVIRVPDNMPDRKCLSVAKRNAILDLIPAATVIAVLRQRQAILSANKNREEVRISQLLGNGSGRRGAEPRQIGGGGAPTIEPTAATNTAQCPKCGGGMFDNRATKTNPKAPDFKCKDRSCDGVIWPSKGNPSNTQGDIPGLDDQPRQPPNAVAEGR